MPAADFCRTVRVNCFTLSPDSGTCSRPPEVSSTAFNAQPPDLQPALLMEMDFAIVGPLVLRRMPPIRFLFIGSRLCSTLLSDSASRRRPCASLSLLLHQDVKGTSTPKLLNMLGTPTYVVLPKENHMQRPKPQLSTGNPGQPSGSAVRHSWAPLLPVYNLVIHRTLLETSISPLFFRVSSSTPENRMYDSVIHGLSSARQCVGEKNL